MMPAAEAPSNKGLPNELWNRIFQYSTDFPIEDSCPKSWIRTSVYYTDHLPIVYFIYWKTIIQARLCIVRVCRSWYRLGIANLYSTFVCESSEKFARFCSTCEENPSLLCYLRHFEVRDTRPFSNEDLAMLIAKSPNLQYLAIIKAWEYSTLASLLSVLQNNRRLETFVYWIYGHSSTRNPGTVQPIVLENLRHLQIRIEGESSHRYQLPSFIMPKLERLDMGYSVDTVQFPFFDPLPSTSNLIQLSVYTEQLYQIRSIRTAPLETPKLRFLKLHMSEQYIDIDLTKFLTIEALEMFTIYGFFDDFVEHLEILFGTLSDRMKCPHLVTIYLDTPETMSAEPFITLIPSLHSRIKPCWKAGINVRALIGSTEDVPLSCLEDLENLDNKGLLSSNSTSLS